MDCDDPFVIKVDIKHQQMAPQLFDTNINPWDVSSLYDFQYFCCPQCVFQGCRIFYPKLFDPKTKLYTPSTLNIDLILWHTQLIVCAENDKS